MLLVVSERKRQLSELLVSHYRSSGWKVEQAVDGTVRAAGPGSVTWIGLAVAAEDLADEAFADRLRTLGEERMPAGERCPLELLPAEECAPQLRSLLAELHLDDAGHVEVYSLVA